MKDYFLFQNAAFFLIFILIYFLFAGSRPVEIALDNLCRYVTMYISLFVLYTHQRPCIFKCPTNFEKKKHTFFQYFDTFLIEIGQIMSWCRTKTKSDRGGPKNDNCGQMFYVIQYWLNVEIYFLGGRG